MQQNVGGGGGGNSLRPYSQQRPMRTNLSSRLGLRMLGVYESDLVIKVTGVQWLSMLISKGESRFGLCRISPCCGHSISKAYKGNWALCPSVEWPFLCDKLTALQTNARSSSTNWLPNNCTIIEGRTYEFTHLVANQGHLPFHRCSLAHECIERARDCPPALLPATHPSPFLLHIHHSLRGFQMHPQAHRCARRSWAGYW